MKSNFVLRLFLGLDKTLVPRKNPEKLGTDSSKLKTIMCVNSCHCVPSVKIYAITINNTVDGGADHCRECPVTSSEKGYVD